MIIYWSPKCLKRVEKVKKTDFFKKTRIETILDKSPWDSTAIFIFFLLFLGSLLKQCSVFEILLQFTLPPPYTKLKLGKKFWIHASNMWFSVQEHCTGATGIPFRLLIKSVSAVSGWDSMVVKLSLHFFCVVWFVFCFVVFFLFVYLYVVFFCFLFLLKNSLLFIV